MTIRRPRKGVACPVRVAKVTGPLGPPPLSSLGGLVLLASFILFAGCEFGPAMFLSGRDRDIRDSTQALATARDDGQRAKAYSSRGAAYSEKARYSRISKLIPNDEYERLFDLAIKDHNQAVALNPNTAEVDDLKARYRAGKVGDVEVKDKLAKALNAVLASLAVYALAEIAGSKRLSKTSR